MYLLAATRGALGPSRLATILGISHHAALQLKRRILASSQHVPAVCEQEVANRLELLSEPADWQSSTNETATSWSSELRFERFQSAIGRIDRAMADREFLDLLSQFMGAPLTKHKPEFEPLQFGQDMMDEAKQFEFDLEWPNSARHQMVQAR